jgi:UDP-N-acetylmuramate--alanine ligase
MQKVHFIGIGGIGISALAQYYLAKGWQVSGSDLERSEIIDLLEKKEIDISIGHRAVNLLEKIDRVIYSAAIKEDNPEMEQARNFSEVEILSYAEALGELTRQYITVAVSGAHGKSTTTALLSLMMIKGGLDPTVIVGTRLSEFNGGNFREGKSRYLVIEADEYNRSFWHYYPTIAIVTNIDKEHLDTYKDLNGVVDGFACYFKNIANIGALIINNDDENIKKAIKIWRTAKLNDDSPRLVAVNALRNKSKKWPLKIPGEFNQLNAELAWQAANLFGVSKKDAQKAVSQYRGSWRRMETLISRSRSSVLADLKFFSDYAHHPTEIKATIKALKEAFPQKKLLVIFQPHQLERLNNLFDDFVAAFNECSRLILLPAYQVAGRELAGRKDSKDLFNKIKEGDLPVLYLKTVAGTFKIIKQLKNAVVVFMGAGDIDKEVRKYFKSKLF